MVYAVAAGGLAAAFLFLPILMLGFVLSVVASVLTGEVVGWRGSVDLTLVVLGPFALLSIVLLLIPLKLWQAAARFLGQSRATVLVGRLLAAAMAGVALLWLLQAQARSSQAGLAPELWYAVVFGLAAFVTLIVSVLIARRTIIAALAVIGLVTASLLVLVGVLIGVWGSPPHIPDDAQTVVIVSTPSGVQLQPTTIHAGEVYLRVQENGDPNAHAEFAFIGAGYAPPGYDSPLPLTEEAVDRLRNGDYQGTASEGGWGGYGKLMLREGSYAFVVFGPQGEQPGVAPQSVTVLRVLP